MYNRLTATLLLKTFIIAVGISIVLSCAPSSVSRDKGSLHPGKTGTVGAKAAGSETKPSVARVQAYIEPTANLNYILGYMAELDNSHEAALEYYSKVLQLDPGASLVKKRLASVLFNLSQYNDSVTLARAALNDMPEDMELVMLLGQAYSNLNRPEEAIDMFERLAADDPGDMRVRLQLAVLYSSVRKYDRSIKLLDPMMEDYAEAALSALTYIGSIALIAGDLDDAEVIFLKAQKYAKDNEGILVNLASVNIKKGKTKNAEKYYKKTLKINPANALALEGLAQLYLKQRKDKKALVVLNTLVGHFPKDIDAMKRRALLMMNLQMHEEAVVALREVVSADPVDTPFRYYLGIAYEESRKYDEAIAEYQKLIAVEPQNTKPYLSLGYLYIQLDLYEEAVDIYHSLMEVAPPIAEYYVYLSRALILMQDKSGAMTTLKEGLELFPDNDDLHFNIAVLYEEDDNFDEMVRHLSRAIEVNPEHADAMNFLGYSYAERGVKLDEALALVTESLNLKPGNGYITDSLGWVYYKLGRYRDARITLNNALSIVSSDPVIYEHLGDVNLASSKKDDAVKSWTQSLEVLDKSDMPHDEAVELRQRLEDKIRRYSTPSDN